jgi:hypothetical protein
MLAIAQMIIPREHPPLVLPLSKLKPTSEALFSFKAHLHEKLQRMSDDAYIEHVSRAVDSFEQQTKNHTAVRSTLAELHRIYSVLSRSGRRDELQFDEAELVVYESIEQSLRLQPDLNPAHAAGQRKKSNFIL